MDRRTTGIRWDRLGRWALIGVFALVLYLYIGPAVSWIETYREAGRQREAVAELRAENQRLRERKAGAHRARRARARSAPARHGQGRRAGLRRQVAPRGRQFLSSEGAVRHRTRAVGRGNAPARRRVPRARHSETSSAPPAMRAWATTVADRAAARPGRHARPSRPRSRAARGHEVVHGRSPFRGSPPTATPSPRGISAVESVAVDDRVRPGAAGRGARPRRAARAPSAGPTARCGIRCSPRARSVNRLGRQQLADHEHAPALADELERVGEPQYSP